MSILIGNGRRSAALIALLFISFSASVWFAVRSSAQKVETAREDNTEVFAPQAGTISGRVFQDFNGNGTYDTTLTLTNDGFGTIPVAIDRGLGNVQVRAYNAAGVDVTTGGVSLSDPTTGIYTITTNDVGSGPYRVEFTVLPTGYTPSARSTDSAIGGSTTNSG